MNTTAYNYFKKYIKNHKMRFTKQREAILKAFLSKGGHLGIDELYVQLRRKHPTLGYTTVYRTLKLLNQAHVASEVNFTGKRKRYERQLSGAHHDHFICLRCNKVIEFFDPVIEKRQIDLCRRRKFKSQSHMLQIFGICKDCNGKKN